MLAGKVANGKKGSEMSDFFTVFHDLKPLGFPGWEASEVWHRGADTRGGRALVQAVRAVGCTLQTTIEAGDAVDLWTGLCRAIDMIENPGRARRENRTIAYWQKRLYGED